MAGSYVTWKNYSINLSQSWGPHLLARARWYAIISHWAFYTSSLGGLLKSISKKMVPNFKDLTLQFVNQLFYCRAKMKGISFKIPHMFIVSCKIFRCFSRQLERQALKMCTNCLWSKPIARCGQSLVTCHTSSGQ